ncbi:MAG: HAMP domain-containing sensor histidine kinase [Clostridia bacterium]
MRNNISTRWLVNSLGVIVTLLVIFIVILSFSIQSYIYNGIQQVLIGRSEELINVFSSTSSTDFITVSRSYIEEFPDKNDMEIMSISSGGVVLVSSSGFLPQYSQAMPDYESALSSSNNFGYWIGELETGEKVMAITHVVVDSNNVVEGSIRYLVSLEKADEQIQIIVLGLILIGIVVTALISFSGLYFIRSIVLPVKQITVSAQKISSGDFQVRIEKKQNDEIGMLIDNINLMAEELGNADRMKNDFISSVSHELRTPLTAIKGWAETLQDGQQDKETAEKGISVIINESQRLSGIVEELLDFSRVQSGRLSLIRKKCDLLAELDEAVFMFTQRATAENKELIYQEYDMFSPIMADINRLRQVFVNVIDNALKYTETGGTITITANEEDKFIVVKVQDTGCGIPLEHLAHVKKKFYKANQVVRGSGIGLALADEIMNMHDGSLEVESVEGVGTIVTINMPIWRKIDE